jgi:DNA repair protein RadC
MALKEIPADARPREKLQSLGPSALADAELIALLLRTGLAGVSVLRLAQQLLDEFNGLGGLLHAGDNDFKRVKGLRPAKRAEIIAVVELASRSLAPELKQRAVLTSPRQVKDFLSLQLAHLGHELFAVLFLNAQHQLLDFEKMFRGTLTQASVNPREVVKRALELQASAVILAHNHPSGVAEPSRADEYLTQALKAALQLIDVRVLDHLVVGRSGAVSFAERGLL